MEFKILIGYLLNNFYFEGILLSFLMCLLIFYRGRKIENTGMEIVFVLFALLFFGSWLLFITLVICWIILEVSIIITEHNLTNK